MPMRALPLTLLQLIVCILMCAAGQFSAEVKAEETGVPGPAPLPGPGPGPTPSAPSGNATVQAPTPSVPPPPVTAPTIVTSTSTPVAISAAPIADVRPNLRRDSLGDYALVWSDEFNAEKLDTTLWDYRTDTKFWSAGREANVTVSGGYLHIALKKEKAGKSEYTAGGVVSKRGFRYGFYEASIKIQSGKGWHTSFWLTAHKSEVTGGRQEIDVCENDSIDVKSYSVNLHQWKPIHRIFDTKKVKTSDLSSEFHVWGCEFTPQKVRYFFDGEQVGSMDAKEMVHDDQSIWITCFAAPLQKTMHVEDDKLPGEVLVDWVRFYEKKK